MRGCWCLRNVSAAVMLSATLLPASPHAQPVREASRRLKVVVVVFDGLRPDHVTVSKTPALYAMAQRGVLSRQHHSLFPTVTRVNASALATGAGPDTHGILDNTIYLPTVRVDRGLNTADAAEMLLADSILGGRLLTARSLHERLAARGLRVVVASAGSSGSAYLLAGAGRAVTLGVDFTRPATLQSLVDRTLGAAPVDASPNLQANSRAVDALLRIGVDSLDSDVAYLWLSDPDHTAHAAGLGSIMADSSIRAADRDFGRLLAGLKARGLDRQVDMFVVSDHGFSTHAGGDAALSKLLKPFGERVVVAGSAVYVRDGLSSTRGEVVRVLQESPAVGAIFTAPGAQKTLSEGVERGTLSYASIGWTHERAGDVLYSANWSHTANAAGIEGHSEQPGVAGHGTSSPHDMIATFVAAGPHIRQGIFAALPSSNADIVPTILHLLGVSDTTGMTGRPLRELLILPRRVSLPRASRDSIVVSHDLTASMLRYRTVAYRTRVGTTWYFDSTKTSRTARKRNAPR